MAEPSRGGIYGIWKSLFPDPDTQPRKKIIKPKTPEPQEEGFVSLYEIGTCGSRLKRSFPAADLITILRIINLKKEDGPFHSILTRLDSDEDPRNRSIIFGQMKGKGVLSKDMIWAFDVLMKSSNPAYELPKMMLKKLNAFEPEGQMKFAEEEPPKKPQTKKVYPGRSLLQKSPEERNTPLAFPYLPHLSPPKPPSLHPEGADEDQAPAFPYIVGSPPGTKPVKKGKSPFPVVFNERSPASPGSPGSPDQRYLTPESPDQNYLTPASPPPESPIFAYPSPGSPPIPYPEFVEISRKSPEEDDQALAFPYIVGSPPGNKPLKRGTTPFPLVPERRSPSKPESPASPENRYLSPSPASPITPETPPSATKKALRAQLKNAPLKRRWSPTHKQEAIGDKSLSLFSAANHNNDIEWADYLFSKDTVNYIFVDRASAALSISYRRYVNPYSVKEEPGLYRVGLSGVKTPEALELCTFLGARMAKDIMVKEVAIMTETSHLQYPSIYPRVIIKVIEGTPMVQFIESLHLILTEDQFELILSQETCVNQPEGWSSVGLARAFVSGNKFDGTVDNCVFSISAEDRVWGPNGSLGWDSHPFTKGFKASSEDEHAKHSFELLVARFDQSLDEWVADYGFFETDTEKYVLHPIALKFMFADHPLPKERTRAIFKNIRKSDVHEWMVRKTKQTRAYLDVLCRYGILKNSLLTVEYY